MAIYEPAYLVEYRREINEFGFAIIPNVVSDQAIEAVLTELEQLSGASSSRRGQVYAARNLLKTVPSIAQLAASPEIRSLVEPILGPAAFPVRGLLFDKVPEANWHVGWHQDQIIPVAEQKETPGFTAWTMKHGVSHVRPPANVLEGMLTLRIHLDDCGPHNGPLQVLRGSHKHGFLADAQIQAALANSEPTLCEASRGAVLAMRPLLLHASSPAREPSHRRVIHLEYAAVRLPGELEWPR